jgi:predicted TIM-barrel fold metal-dependent hydrolase
MQIDPTDRRLTKYYETLVHLGLPLLTHTGRERSFSSAADQLCDPDRLRLPLEVGVKVIAAHIASTGSYQGERSTDRLARMMTQYPNLYSDISALTQINKPGALNEALTRREFADRLLYGTDFPLINTALVSPWYFALRLGPSRLFHVSQTENPWDADVLLKHYLGTTADIFSRSRALLHP